MNLSIKYSNVANTFEVVGVVKLENRCCKDEPVLITKTRCSEVYSCQCNCGGWCTTGYPTMEEAIAGWKELK